MPCIAVIQFDPVFGAVDQNIATTSRLIRQAAAEGADLVVLPELSNSGYMFASRDELAELSEVIGSGPASTAWAQVAAELDVHIVAGITESAQDRYYNSAALIGPRGTLATYRKMHLWNEEALWFTPGDKGYPVVETALGRIGMLICYDGWFPESYRSLVLQGADIVCVPTNWVPIPGQVPGQQAMATVLTMANAHCNGMVIAAADRCGVERGQQFIGQSVIVGPTGWPLAGPAPEEGSAILGADVDLNEIRASRTWNKFNDPVANRRPETYLTYDSSPASDPTLTGKLSTTPPAKG